MEDDLDLTEAEMTEMKEFIFGSVGDFSAEEETEVNVNISGSHQQDDYTHHQFSHHNQDGSALPHHHTHPPHHHHQGINYHHHHNQLYHRQNHPHLHHQGAGGIAANHVHQNQGAGGNYHSYSSNPQNHHQNGNGDAGIAANAGSAAATSTTPIPIPSDICLQKLPDNHVMILSNIVYAQNGKGIPPAEIKKIWGRIHSSMSSVASNWADQGESSYIGNIIQAQRRAYRNYIDVPSHVTDSKSAASLFVSETEVKQMYESFSANASNINSIATAGMFLNRLVSLWVWLTLKIQKHQTTSDHLATNFLNTFCAEVGLPPNSLIFEGGNAKAKLTERLMKNASGKVRAFPGASTKKEKDSDFWLNLISWITGLPKPFLKGILGNIRVTLVSPTETSLNMNNEQVAKRETDTYLMLNPSKKQHTIVFSKNIAFPRSMIDSDHSIKGFCFIHLLRLVASKLNTNVSVSGKRVFFIYCIFSPVP